MNEVVVLSKLVMVATLAGSAAACAAAPVLTSVNPGASAVGDWRLQTSEASRYTEDATGLADAARQRGRDYCAARSKAFVIDHEEAVESGGGDHVGLGPHSTTVAHGESYVAHQVFFSCAFPDDVERIPVGTPACSGKLATLSSQASRAPIATTKGPPRRWVDKSSGPILIGILGADTSSMLVLFGTALAQESLHCTVTIATLNVEVPE